MQTTKQIISQDQRELLRMPEKICLGTFSTPSHPHVERRFIIACDARPLLALFEAAAFGSCIYELMTIRRPAEILHYLYLTIIDVDKTILDFVARKIKGKTYFKVVNLEGGIPFIEFDQCFTQMEEDNTDFERMWMHHRRSFFWKKKLSTLFALSQEVQRKIRQSGDFLSQHEISLIENGKHHRDFKLTIDRPSLLECSAYKKSNLPDPLFATIARLIKQEDINSVSFPFNDYPLWRLLVEEQIRRVEKNGRTAKEVFYLSGPDGCQMNLTGADMRRYPNEPEDWGGEVHIPYEGAVGGDLFIKPDWHNFRKDYADEDGSLSDALFGKQCRYMLSQQDFGELGCASRKVVGDWVLYSSHKK